MRIARKYPLFLLLTTIGTSGASFFALLEVLDATIEREITKRGEATVESFAMANAPQFLTYPPERGRALLQFNLLAVAKNPDVVNARVADNAGVILASLTPAEIGTRLPSYFVSRDAPAAYSDPHGHAYHFRASVRYGDDTLGVFVLSLSRTPLEVAVQRARTRAILYAAGIAVVMSIFTLLLVRREVRPLKLMSITLAAIAKGDFAQRVAEDRADEIGDLAAGFNRMLRRAELFFLYVDKLVIERLIADESLTRPGGRERDIAVAFGDMRGFTAMSNRRTADEVVRIVNTYFHLFVECIAHWEGVVDKTMGDAIMAVFERDDKEDLENHKRRGVLALAYMKAASRVLSRFLTLKQNEIKELGIEPREFGFAIATGRAIVGNIGSRRRMDYTVCGRVVNLASRLEGLTKNGEVIIDNFTRLGTRDLIVCQALPPVQPKGFSAAEKVTPHRVVGVSDEEAHKLRVFLKRLFTHSYVNEMLMPKSLPVGEQQPWCQAAELLLIRIIAETPLRDFFARANIETGELISDGDVTGGGEITPAA